MMIMFLEVLRKLVFNFFCDGRMDRSFFLYKGIIKSRGEWVILCITPVLDLYSTSDGIEQISWDVTVHFHNIQYRLLPCVPYSSGDILFCRISNGKTFPQHCISSSLISYDSPLEPWLLRHHSLMVLGVWKNNIHGSSNIVIKKRVWIITNIPVSKR